MKLSRWCVFGIILPFIPLVLVSFVEPGNMFDGVFNQEALAVSFVTGCVGIGEIFGVGYTNKVQQRIQFWAGSLCICLTLAAAIWYGWLRRDPGAFKIHPEYPLDIFWLCASLSLTSSLCIFASEKP